MLSVCVFLGSEGSNPGWSAHAAVSLAGGLSHRRHTLPTQLSQRAICILPLGLSSDSLRLCYACRLVSLETTEAVCVWCRTM